MTGDWIAPVGVGIGLALNLASFAVAWGVMKGALTAVSARVAALEGKLTQLGKLEIAVAKIEAGQVFLLEQMKDLNASIRWMRSPALYDSKDKPS